MLLIIMRQKKSSSKNFLQCLLPGAMAAAIGAGCLDESLTAQYVRVKMVGVFEEPPTQENHDDGSWFEPISQTYTLSNVVMVTSSGETEEVHELYGKDEPTKFRITDRLQRIYRKVLDSSLAGHALVRFIVVLERSAEGASKFKGDHKLDLATLPACTATAEATEVLGQETAQNACILEYAEPFSIGIAQSYTFVIKVQWKNTVLRVEAAGTTSESMDLPNLVLDLDKS